MIIKKLDLLRTGFRTFYVQSLWNYESLLAYGMAFAILPVLQKLYSRHDIIRKGREYLSYFNTQPYLSAFILGLLIKLEEESVESGQNNSSRIRAVKMNYMGPLAALGDSFFWWCLKPLALIFTISMVLYFDDPKLVFYFLLIFFIFFNGFHLFYRFGSVIYGYKFGEAGLKLFKLINFDKFQKILFQLGLFLSGIIIAMLVLRFPVRLEVEAFSELSAPPFQIFYGISILILFLLYKMKKSPLLLITVTLVLILVFSYLSKFNILNLRIS